MTVSDNGDPALVDGSAGTGVDSGSFTSPLARNTSGAHILNATVKDKVGNESTAATASVKVDATAPAVTLDCSQLPAAVYKGDAVTLPWRATDAHSGINGAASGSVSLSTTTVGSRAASVAAGTAQDNVGHGNAVSNGCTYTVIYRWTGFFQPIDNKDTSGNYVLNKAKAGSTIPVKFSLAGDQGLDILATSPSAPAIACSNTATSDPLEEYSTTTVSGLKYDPTADQYIYNWKTATSYAGTCRQLVVKLSDGTEHRASFSFVK